MKSVIVNLVIVLTVISSKGVAQVTDIDIIRSLLGKSYNRTHPTLDSLGVWYHFQPFENKQPHKHEEVRSRVFSIANGRGSVKVYFLKLNENKVIDEIVINYRHDNREQVEDASNISNATEVYVGYYSTDLVFKWQNK